MADKGRTIEKVTPELAKKYLESSKLKRSVSQRVVAGYAALMARGLWHPYPPIEFDGEDHLVNGHQRLHAIVLCDTSVDLEVVRGVPEEVHSELDTGRPRSMHDLFRMYRPNTEYDNYKSASVKIAARLLTGQEQRVRSLIEYDLWERPFRDGVKWATKELWTKPGKGNVARASGVSGALVFAYKSHPEKVAEFGEKLLNGENLKAGSPPLVLRNSLLRDPPGRKGGEFRAVLSRQVLNAVLAYINNETMGRVTSDDTGRQFFLDAYKRTQKISIDAAE